MNIEELSKSQLILLTILVNFVTSVATGILTVSLLDTAPPYVTQTINRVVERTIETVASAAPAVVVAPAPSNQDLVTAAIGANATRFVVIYAAATGVLLWLSSLIAGHMPSPKCRSDAFLDTTYFSISVIVKFLSIAFFSPNAYFCAFLIKIIYYVLKLVNSD